MKKYLLVSGGRGSIGSAITNRAEDIADQVAFLLDEGSKQITGQVFYVDGGAKLK